ncbi:hypothetical protein ABBQ38_003570 [Trebouxia sp. C0009 RCD-2024]
MRWNLQAAHPQDTQKAWQQVFLALNVADNQADASRAVAMLPDCPHLPLQEEVMAKLCQAHPFRAITCGIMIGGRQKLSPGCCESMLLALALFLATGFAGNLYALGTTWHQGLSTAPHQQPSTVPCFPTPAAFQELLKQLLGVADWPSAARLAVEGASLYQEAAQDGLRAALAGAREAAKQDSTVTGDMQSAAGTSSSSGFQELVSRYVDECPKHDDPATLALFHALDFRHEYEGMAAYHILTQCDPATSPKLQHVYLNGWSQFSDLGSALEQLQQPIQLADQHVHLYRTVLARLALTPGDQAIQLYRHLQSEALPLLMPPPTDKLADVAKLCSELQDWETALAAAQDVAVTDTQAAAQLVNKIMEDIQMYGFNISVAAAAMPLFGLLEAQCTECIQPDHLYMSCLAWANLRNTTAALEALRRHEPLTAAWTAEQQQLVFHSMLRLHEPKLPDDSAIQVTQHVWMVAVRNKLPDRQPQLHELVMALLSPGRLPMAHQVLQRAAQLGALQADVIEPVLAKSLQQDARSRSSQMSETSRSLLGMMKQAAGALWPQRLHETTALLLTEALLQESNQLDVAHMCEARTAASLALWDAAMSVYHSTGRDEASMCRAWDWMQLKGLSWAPSDAACYVSIAHAVTAQGDSRQGAHMLTSYHDKAYSIPLSVSDCDTFIKLCMQGWPGSTEEGVAVTVDTQEGISAALGLLHHMKQTSLPAPAVSTFTQATLCALAQLKGAVPAHQVLMQLQQDVWAHMHTGDDNTAYLAALNVFEGTQGVQTAVLMSQNGVSGLCGDACLALACVMEEDHEAWLRETFGGAFVDELQILADSTSPEPVRLAFPAHPLPKLSVVQLGGKPSHLGVADGDTPWWMVPATAWQHGLSLNHAASQHIQPPVDQGPQLSAAEQLAAEFGHLENASRSKRRK